MKSFRQHNNDSEDIELKQRSGKKYTVADTNEVTLLSNTRTLCITLCILVTEMCERLTYYSVVANMVLYCTSHLGMGQAKATEISQAFGGCVYIIPIFGGFISDSFAGRFMTIVCSCILYLIGTFLLPVSAVDYDTWGWSPLSNEGKTAIFVIGLVFVALGTGGIKANVGPFGAEQVEKLGKGAVRSFFNWFYWVVNVGAFVAYAGVAYVQQEISFAWGYLIPFISMSIALVIFVSARSHYVRTVPKGSILSTALSICRQGCCKSTPPKNSNLPEGTETKMLACAKKSFGGHHDDHLVDGVSSAMKVTPFCLLVVMYWAIYAQMSSTFFAQSERMDIRLGDFSLPAAALNIFDTIIIIILVPFVDRLLYPFFERIGRPLTYLKRIGLGMILASMAVVVAGVVEIYRKEDLEKHRLVQELAKEKFNSSSLSVFIQVPQFALIGASEIFTSVTTLEFAYNQAPVSMQGLLTGLFLAASGVGNWVSMAIIAIVQKASENYPWWNDEINDCKMEYLQFLLGGLMFVNFLIFCVISYFYTYQDPATFEEQPEERGKQPLEEKGNLP